MTKDEAMKLALEAMGLIGADLVCEAAHHEKADRHGIGEPCPIQARWHHAFTALREALAEQPAQQEPVARQYQGRDGVWKDFISEKHYKATLEDGSWPIRNLYTSPQSKPLTDEMVVAAARVLSDRQAAACNVDCGDMWKLHGNDFIDDARAALEAAHNIKENT